MSNTKLAPPKRGRSPLLACTRGPLPYILLVLAILTLSHASGVGPTTSAAASAISLGALNGPNGYRIEGRNAGDRAGKALKNAGDVNGDGLDDYIIGASAAGPDGKQGAGEAYVVFGSTTNPSSLPLAALNGQNGFRLVGATFNTAAGEAVGGGGDVNGDGYADLIIGAPGAAPGGIAEAGAAYVVFGAAAFPERIELDELDGNNGFRIDGVTEGQGLGASASLAGDLNGDGYDDVLVGAPNATVGNKTAAGLAYVVFGDKSLPAQLSVATLDGATGFRVDGVSSESYAGNDVGAAGDMNGDGFSDGFIAAWKSAANGGNESGATFIIFGKSNYPAKLTLNEVTGGNGFRIEGIAAGDRSGRSVRSAGDVNGDGRGDLVIGAPFADNNTGAAYVVLGANSFPSTVSLGGLNGANGFVLSGDEAHGQAGMAVGAADVNGDGLDDVLVGASAAGSGNRRFAGKSYIVFGRPSFAAEVNLAGLSAAVGLQIDGAVAGDQSGQAISAAGDIDGDGFDEILIGAPNAGGGPNSDVGFVFLLQGGPTLGVTLPITHPGTPDDDVINGTTGKDAMLGNLGDDRIAALGNDDSLKGGAGDDTLQGGPGADRLRGGNGVDTASYSDATSGVTVNLFTGAASGGDAAGDRLSSIENVTGSPHGDTLAGDARANRLEGGAGNDTLSGGRHNDAFVFGPQSGDDVITDFVPGPGSDDYIDFALYTSVNDPGDLTIRAEGGNTVITLPGDATIKILGVSPGALHDDDYRFAGAPLARPDRYNTPAGTPLVVAAPGVLANDENPATAPLSAGLVAGPGHGSLGFNPDGSFTYTPDAGFLGDDQFTYRANNGRPSNVARVTLTVTPLPPVAVDDTYTASIGQTLTVPAPGVLGNDQRLGGPPLSALLIEEPVDGALVLNANGSFTYTPSVDYPTQDRFRYVAVNGLTSEIATVVVNVLDPDGPPVAVDDSYQVAAGQTLAIAAPGVLANDIAPVAGSMTARLVNGPAHGQLNLESDGSFRYTPQAGYSGEDRFTYRADNGQLSDVATVRLSVGTGSRRLYLPSVLGD